MSRRVLITGAASGIGAATAAKLREHGAQVAGLDLNPREGIIACDVRDQDSVERAVAQAITGLGGLDVLINCAGVGDPQSAAEPPGADALHVLDVNLLGTWRVTAECIDALRESHGRVINVASGLAYLSVPFAPAYCASKRGIVGYSDSLRLELAGVVEVTTVYPGYVRTPIHAAAAAHGLTLEGSVPAEPLSAAADTLVRAALGPARRDLATTRRGAFAYGLLRVLPRRLVDRATFRRLRATGMLSRGARLSAR